MKDNKKDKETLELERKFRKKILRILSEPEPNVKIKRWIVQNKIMCILFSSALVVALAGAVIVGILTPNTLYNIPWYWVYGIPMSQPMLTILSIGIAVGFAFHGFAIVRR